MIMRWTTGCSRPGLFGLWRLVLATFIAVAAGCSSQPPQIAIEAPTGELSPLFIGAGSFYLTVRNTGGKDALVGASVALPKTVTELHDVRDGRMVKVERIAVPAQGALELRPGSNHIMVFNMPKTVQKGSELALTLTFERSGERTVQVQFQK